MTPESFIGLLFFLVIVGFMLHDYFS